MWQTSAKKVFVGLSGGVDSSVSALLLKRAGYDVTGVFMRVWQPSFAKASEGKPDFFPHCTMADDRLDAMRVCAKLSIPFVELNLEKGYKKEVVDYMIREYKAGKTPNPDVMCNRFIKFGAFYKFALVHGADYVATGHYARIVKRKSYNAKRQTLANPTLYTLQTGFDASKDQSYFLWQIRKEQLPHILFPIGTMKKPEVRKLAKKFGLITADKKDSQGLCFVGKVDMKEFLSHYIKQRKGKVLNERGDVLGEHDGAVFYTIGERLGEFTRSNPEPGKRFALPREQPFYVVAKDIRRNTLIVGEKSQRRLSGAVQEIRLKNCNWLTPPRPGKAYHARTRYRQALQSAEISAGGGFAFGVKNRNGKWLVAFKTLQSVAAGQSLVLYEGDTLIGGGIIA